MYDDKSKQITSTLKLGSKQTVPSLYLYHTTIL
nr:MAG TPA: hypothetical protein [Bacteriophage sp.]